jgi:hypothetical protein
VKKGAERHLERKGIRLLQEFMLDAVVRQFNHWIGVGDVAQSYVEGVKVYSGQGAKVIAARKPTLS